MKKNISKHLIWNGFYYKWKNFPHRIAILGNRFNNIVADTTSISAYHEKALKIGNLGRETADYGVYYAGVATENIFVGTGRIGPLSIICPIEKGIEKVYETTVDLADLQSTFKLKQFKNGKTQKVAVLCNGFFLKPVNNISGWHFGGLGIKVEHAIMVDKTKARFRVRVYCRPASSPEPAPHGNRDEANNKWTAKDECEYELHVDYCLVVGEADNMDVLNVGLNKSNTQGYEFLQNMPVTIYHEPQKYQHAFVGLQGFYFHLNSHKANATKSGRYIREISAYVHDVKYNAKKGTLFCNGFLGLSNTILSSKSFTAIPWNVDACLYLSSIALNTKASINYHTYKDITPKQIQKNSLGEHNSAFVFPKRIQSDWG